MSSELILSIVLLLLGTLNVSFAEPQCHLIELRACIDPVANFVNSLEKRTLPTTESKMKELCEVTHGAIDCFDDFKGRCMTPVQNEIEKIISEGAREYSIQFCAPGSPQIQTYLKYAVCLNEQVGTTEMRDAMLRSEAMLEKLHEIPLINLLKHGCCGWNSVFATVKSLAIKNCGPESAKILDELFAAVVSTLPDVICGDFDPESEECTAILPPKGAKPVGDHNPVVDAIRYFFRAHLED